MLKHGFLSFVIFITEFFSSLFEFQLTPIAFQIPPAFPQFYLP